nr:TetR/AcrR family transcriptional regulator [uncultured Bacillus sp.]
MVKDKVDLRVQKTKRAIKEAFLTLVQTKGYERITVQDIADTALINRNTFYLHYLDKPDLAEKLCHESLKKLNVCSNLDITEIHEIDKATYIASLTTMLKIIEEDIGFFKAMLSQNGLPDFSIRLNEAYRNFFLRGIEEHDLKTKVGLKYMVSGLVGVICLWILDHENLKVEDIVKQLSEFHFKNALDLV